MSSKFHKPIIAGAMGILLLSIIILLTVHTGTNNESSNAILSKDEVKVRFGEAKNSASSANTSSPQLGDAGSSPPQTAGTANKQNTSIANLKARKIIQSGSLTIETNKFDAAVNAISIKVQQEGGYIENAEINGVKSTNGNYLQDRTASYIIRIPCNKFEGFMNQLGTIGVVTSKTARGEDITAQYIDNEARLKSQKIKEERLNGILKKASKLSDILAIETELENTRYEIESLTSSLKKWDNLVSYSSLTVQLTEVMERKELAKKPVTMPERLSEAFNSSIKLLVDIAKGLLVAIAAFLPFAVILAVILVAAYSFKRHLKRKSSHDGTE